MQSVGDPRPTFAQRLSTLLIAELADNAGWEPLVELSEADGHTAIAKRFKQASREVTSHLQQVRVWREALAKNELAVIATAPHPNVEARAEQPVGRF